MMPAAKTHPKLRTPKDRKSNRVSRVSAWNITVTVLQLIILEQDILYGNYERGIDTGNDTVDYLRCGNWPYPVCETA